MNLIIPKDYKPALDIRQTPTGELQIDLNQVDALDKTMLMFGETAAG